MWGLIFTIFAQKTDPVQICYLLKYFPQNLHLHTDCIDRQTGNQLISQVTKKGFYIVFVSYFVKFLSCFRNQFLIWNQRKHILHKIQFLKSQQCGPTYHEILVWMQTSLNFSFPRRKQENTRQLPNEIPTKISCFTVITIIPWFKYFANS